MEVKYSNIEAEQVILGEIIMNNDKLSFVIDFLEPKHFSVPQHEKLYKHILQVIAGIKVDAVTLKEFFKYEKSMQLLGGLDYLKELLGSISSFVSVRDYGKQVVELWKKREIDKLLSESLSNLGSNKFEPLVSNLMNQVAGLSIESEVHKTIRLSDVAAKVNSNRELGIKPKIIPSELGLLDKKLNGGFYAKRLYVLAAGAGTGKTSLSVQLLLTAGRQNKSCLFFSMEMDETEIYFKSIAHMASISPWKMQRDLPLNQAETEAKIRADNALESLPIYVNGTDKARVSSLETLLKRQLALSPVDLVIVDYIQIIDTDQDKNVNQADLIKRNTTALKNMAKKYDVAVIALSQIKRNDNKEPTLEDLKGSGGIGEDADMVMILYSPDKDAKDNIRDIKMVIRKNRWGALGETEMTFDGEFGRFTENNNF
jgi:replicative DNA helicase